MYLEANSIYGSRYKPVFGPVPEPPFSGKRDSAGAMAVLIAFHR